jgi:peptidoglycan/LPS O-acetylase OafA/YrhL
MDQISLEVYEATERRLAVHEARRGLRIHAAVTVAVAVVLAVVNVFVAPEFPWAIFPALGMALGVWFHWYFGVRHGEEFLTRHQQDVEREAQRVAA